MLFKGRRYIIKTKIDIYGHLFKKNIHINDAVYTLNAFLFIYNEKIFMTARFLITGKLLICVFYDFHGCDDYY